LDVTRKKKIVRRAVTGGGEGGIKSFKGTESIGGKRRRIGLVFPPEASLGSDGLVSREENPVKGIAE